MINCKLDSDLLREKTFGEQLKDCGFPIENHPSLEADLKAVGTLKLTLEDLSAANIISKELLSKMNREIEIYLRGLF